MKKIQNIFSLCIFILAFSSCSSNRFVKYQSESESTSTIKIKPTSSLQNVVVTVDGNLVWEKSRKVKSLTIENVPAGNHELHVSSASWIYKNEINHVSQIELKGKGETKTEIVSVPPYSAGYWIYSGVIYFVVVGLPLLVH